MIDVDALVPTTAIVAISLIVIVRTTLAWGRRRRNRREDEVLRAIADRLDALCDAQNGLARVVDTRLTTLEQVHDTMKVEIERVGEGQRFMSKLLTNRQTSERAP